MNHVAHAQDVHRQDIRAFSNKSYVSGASERPLLGLTVGDVFDKTADKFPDRDAVISLHQNVRCTYRELKAQVDICARALLALGVKKGDRVGIWAANRIEWTVLQIAAAKAAVILVNVNPAYRPTELLYALNQSGCSILVMAPRFRSGDYIAFMNELCPELAICAPGALKAEAVPSLRQVILMDGPGAENIMPGMTTWHDFLARADEVSPQTLAAVQADIDFDDPVNIQYTSGTTGRPKGATLSHHNMVNNGYFGALRQGFTERDRLCVPLPLYHVFGCTLATMGCFTLGAAMIFPGDSFDAVTTLKALSDERCTSMYGVPTMFIAVLDVPDFASYDLSALRTGMIGGAPCPVELMHKIMQRMNMREVETVYGMTETSPLSFQSMQDDPVDRRVGTVGLVHPHVEVKIISPETGKTLQLGESGELCTRGYSVMIGYWNDPEATARSIDKGGWMHSGDLAQMDEEGYVKIVGRLKDMIIRGGENIFPREIEEFLHTHPQISDVHVVGVPDAKYGEEVMAWVRLLPGNDAAQVDLRAYCEGKIATYKIPRYWKFVEEFPMTVTGKVQKFAMREIAAAELAELAQARSTGS